MANHKHIASILINIVSCIQTYNHASPSVHAATYALRHALLLH